MKDEIRIFALMNALEHGGKASMGSVIGKMMATHPEMRKDPRSLSIMVKEILPEINRISPEEQKVLLGELGGAIELDKRERKDPMVPLENAGGKVRMRFAPGPSGPLHIGHTRAAILNDEYCRRYGGALILRLEDTNPEKIDPDAYEMISEDLEWLEVKVNETYRQSDRFDTYYPVVRKLIEKGAAYVCTMDPEEWRELKTRSIACPERDLPPEIQLEEWDRMMGGNYDEGEASLVIKTDLDHRNPAVRDFVGMRIRHTPHPLTGDRYHLYPLYNLSVAIDDHLMECTHILRGKDHLNNTIRQEYVYHHMGWELPDFIHYGLVSIPNTLLKTSLIREKIRDGTYSGWSDVRLGTVRALAERGFHPGSIRKYWTEVGIKPVDIRFSWETLETMNREMIDGIAERYFFVRDPVSLSIRAEGPIEGKAPLHPGQPRKGHRNYLLKPLDGFINVFVPEEELKSLEPGEMIRLKDLINVKVEVPGEPSGSAVDMDFESYKDKGLSIIEWAPGNSPGCTISMPNGKVVEGRVEPAFKEWAREGKMVQFERFGFCRVSSMEPLTCNFTHK